jgi:hypothetical protein
MPCFSVCMTHEISIIKPRLQPLQANATAKNTLIVWAGEPAVDAEQRESMPPQPYDALSVQPLY